MICLQMTGEGKHAAYEYRCNDCGETFEQRKSILPHDTAKPKCPKCGSEKV